MRLINFLNEGRSKSISEKEFFNGIQKNCKQSIKRAQIGYLIYRKILKQNDDFLFLKPSGELRKSANTRNYYTLWINNHPSWKNYPKREIICAGGSGKRAFHHGSSGSNYIVLPFDDAKIGICPSDDIWYSFSKLKKFENLDSLNDVLYNCDIRDTKWESFYKDIKNKDFSNDFFNLKEISGYETIEDFLIDVLDPQKNNFKVKNINNYGVPPSKNLEVWTDASCYFIKFDLAEKYNLLDLD